jgi:hypothetical protein
VMAMAGGARLGAEVIASEGFNDYGLGTAVGQTGGEGRWTEPWRHIGLPNQQQVIGIGLDYEADGVTIDGGERALEVTGGKAGGILARAFESVGDSPVYLRFLIQLADETLSPEDFAAIYFNNGIEGPQAGFTDYGVFFARLFLSKSQNAFVSSGALEPKKTYLLVMKLEKAGERFNKVSFWVNPARNAGETPDAVTESPSDRSAELIESLGIRIGKATTLEDKVIFDEIVVADSWDSSIEGK